LKRPTGLTRALTTAYDRVGPNDGTLTNGPVRTGGFAGRAVSFDGNNDYVDVPDHDSLDFGAGEDFSVQAWIKPTDVSGTKTILDKRGSSNLGYAVFLHHGKLGLNLADCSSYDNYVVPADMSIAADDEWHFVFVPVDRDGSATFYVERAPLHSKSLTRMIIVVYAAYI